MMQLDPTMVVNFELFQRNQFPYLEVRRPFILGTAEKRWSPTLSHYFIRVLNDKGILKRLYTQNIDGLDFHVGLPVEKIVHLHGNMASISCEICGSCFPKDDFVAQVRSKIRNIYDETDVDAPKESSNIDCLNCLRPGIKPTTVMYGRNLSKRVVDVIEDDFHCQENKPDLMIVIGTSLMIHPAAGLVQRVSAGVPRLVVNMERVGEDLGLDYSLTGYDAHIPGYSDSALLYILKELGWQSDIMAYKANMCQNSQELLSGS
jgi:NAD-dependent SIR2 family protein deacetylase